MGCMSNASSRFLFRELIRPQSWGHELEEMEADPNNLEFANYKNRDAPLQLSHHFEKSWDEAYHGTWFYGLWSLLYHGILLESRNVGEGRLLFSCSLQRFVVWLFGVQSCVVTGEYCNYWNGTFLILNVFVRIVTAAIGHRLSQPRSL